ncbi:cytochrome P450 [Penicillium angulare]|uniref:cytochrome P450 n=1 Tax=Penicillium angulare TaxID=116970 RepID=UPI0025414B3E|nr:cytochrome P450 [Penicillium angulare]KAJ5280848.1 cytochrome P450 [Penicillium angulare]
MELNYRRAIAMGIPAIRQCFDGSNLLWQIAESPVWTFLDKLGVELGSFRYSRRGWYFYDQAQTHIRLGPVWALVSPRGICLYIADAEIASEIFERRADFIRPFEAYKILEVYGPCISTADQDNWARHRKVVATPFNESAMSSVWDESIKQSEQMVEAWTSPGHGYIKSAAQDTRTVSLNVLAATGFRKSYPFQSANDPQKANIDNTASYRDNLQIVLDNIIMLLVVPRKILTLPFAPNSWHKVAEASAGFQNYMAQMLDEETKAMNENKAGSGSMVTSFVRAMDLNQKTNAQAKAISSSSKGLTVEEIFGNMFAVNFAGHDTTANTLSFVMILLSAYPEVQGWVSEELQQLTPEEMLGQYTNTFSKLHRCQALMHETLRIFSPVGIIMKRTNHQSQHLATGNKSILIPPNTNVWINMSGIHANPKYWEDPMKWNPSRWVHTPPNSEKASTLQDERLIISPRCTYFPWSEGPQNCPGSKFSQVEFVAVMAHLLRDHRIHAIPNPGETTEQLRSRILAVTQDVDLQLLIRMRDADRVHLACRRV